MKVKRSSRQARPDLYYSTAIKFTVIEFIRKNAE